MLFCLVVCYVGLSRDVICYIVKGYVMLDCLVICYVVLSRHVLCCHF